ncbi:MAG: nucleoside-diphosphate sugar epimerase/dehydratase [Bacteroidales bacterium]
MIRTFSAKFPEWKELLRRKASEIFRIYSVPRWLLFIHDNLVVFVSFLLAYLLRYNFVLHDVLLSQAVIHGIIASVVYASFMILFRSYAGLIRHTTLTDVSLVIVSNTSAAIALIIISMTGRQLSIEHYIAIPYSIILIHYVLVSVELFIMRISVKLFFRFATSSMNQITKNVLIYGAGEMGFVVKRVMLSDPRGGFVISGFIDDNRQLQGKKINGIHVYGPEILTPDFVSKRRIKTLIIAIRGILPAKKSQIISKAMDSNLEILETPAIELWLNGRLELRQLKKVKLEDLLGRDPIRLNMEIIRKGLAGKTILVTGAAGSIGSEIVRQLTRFSTQMIILVDQAETPIFHIENELRRNHGHTKFKSRIADITNIDKMESVFSEFKPEIVFHAAAYKHVPLMEENPHEAFRTNIGGTKILTDLAVKYGVRKFVMISSDKSVNPTNVMGASKRACEIVVQWKSMREGLKTQFVITRFGNVLGSNGSVIPLFRKQIEDGGPVTVTHPDITRYFMTIPEACQLVLEAGFMGKGGEIFVFDMGKPVKIVDLATNMIRLSGLEPGKDIKIQFTGLRPGEKLYEELLSDKELILPTHHEKIKIATIEKRDYTDEILKINSALDDIYSLTETEVIELFREIVPEYRILKDIFNGKTKKKPAGRSLQGIKKTHAPN